MKACLETLGFTNVDMFSDHKDLNSLIGENEDWEAFVNYMITLLPDYTITVSLSDIYTYKYGGGISKIKALVDIFNWNIVNDSLKIVVASEKDENDYQKYTPSLKAAMESICKVASEEIVKYTK